MLIILLYIKAYIPFLYTLRLSVKDILENTDIQIAGAYSLTTTLTLAILLKVYQPFSSLFKKCQIKRHSLDSKMLLQSFLRGNKVIH